MLILY
jgi:hypothetical protein